MQLPKRQDLDSYSDLVLSQEHRFKDSAMYMKDKGMNVARAIRIHTHIRNVYQRIMPCMYRYTKPFSLSYLYRLENSLSMGTTYNDFIQDKANAHSS